MNKLITFCIRAPKACIALFIIFTIFFLFNALRIEVDSNLWSILPRDKGSSMDLIDNNGYMFLGIEPKDGTSLFNQEGLEELYRAIYKLEGRKEIQSSISIFNFQTLLAGNKGRLIPGNLLPHSSYPRNDKELALLKKRAIDDIFLKDFLVCNDGNLINTLFITKQSVKKSEGFIDDLNLIIKPLNDYYNISVAGDLILSNRAEYFLLKDFSTLLVGALLIMLFIFFISFKAKRAIIIPVIVVLTGVVWCVGLLSLLGFKLTIVTCVVPALVLTIGSSYTVHVLSEIYRNAPIQSSGSSLWVSEAVSHINKTIAIAAVTTIIGFISLVFASQDIIKEFAITVSFGVFTVALLSVFFLPALFSLLSHPTLFNKGEVKTKGLDNVLKRVVIWVVRHYITMVILGLAIALSSIFFVPKLTIGSDYYNYFPKGDPVISSSLELFEKNGGTLWVNITLEANEDGYFNTPQGLELLSVLDDTFQDNRYIYRVESFVTYLKKVNQLRFGDYELPKSRGLISLLKRSLLKIDNRDINILPLVEDNKMTFYLRIYDKIGRRVIPETEFNKFFQPLENSVKDIVADNARITYWGNGYTANRASSLFLGDQLLTMVISFILVLLVAIFYFKSIYLGIIAVVPLITAICLNYCFMVIFRIPLDMTTIMVSSVAIGVGIDDAVHFLIQYKKQYKIYPNNIRKVLYITFRITGRPIVLTTASIVSGMLVLCFASFLPIRYFGILVALSLVGALIGTLFFLPAALVVSQKIFKRK